MWQQNALDAVKSELDAWGILLAPGMHTGPQFPISNLQLGHNRCGCPVWENIRLLTNLRVVVTMESLHTSTMALLQECIYLHENTVLYKLKTNLKEGVVQACRSPVPDFAPSPFLFWYHRENVLHWLKETKSASPPPPPPKITLDIECPSSFFKENSCPGLFYLIYLWNTV